MNKLLAVATCLLAGCGEYVATLDPDAGEDPGTGGGSATALARPSIQVRFVEGQVTPDAGAPVVDAGQPEQDAGQVEDSGTPVTDAGPVDAGSDAGSPPPVDAGTPDAGLPTTCGNEGQECCPGNTCNYAGVNCYNDRDSHVTICATSDVPAQYCVSGMACCRTEYTSNVNKDCIAPAQPSAPGTVCTCS